MTLKVIKVGAEEVLMRTQSASTIKRGIEVWLSINMLPN